MIISGIYKITSPSGRIYIGQSKNISVRLSKYKRYLCQGQTRLYHSLIKHGWDSHKIEILIECAVKELNYWEEHFIKFYDTFDTQHGLNLIVGGGVSRLVSKETRVKLGLACKGIKKSEEQKKKMSASAKGKIKSLAHRESIRVSRTGTKLPESTKEKLRVISSSKRHSEFTKQKCRELNYKWVLNTQTGIFYWGVKSAADTIGLRENTLVSKLIGRNRNNTPFIYV